MRRSFSFLRGAGLVVGAGLAACVALSQTGCSGLPDGESTSGTYGTAGDDVGTVGMKLTLPGGEQLASASWTITGPNGATTVVQSGTVNVQNSQTIALTVGGIPAGSGYTITVNGVSTDGTVTCAGSAGFAVAAQQTSSVTVLMQCMSMTPNTGSANINGTPYTCAVANGASASPSEAVVGGMVSLSASATSANPSAISYTWSASSGTFSAPNASATSFTCTASGSFTMTVTVSDGAVPDGGTCNLSPASASVIVQCDVGPDGGVQDATVADGSSSDASSASEAGSDATASDAQASDAQTSDATASDAQSSDAQSSDASADAAAPQAAVVVYRVGTSEAGALSSSAAPVFVDSYGFDGTPLGSTAMPTAVSGSNHRLTSSGSATSEGLITLSTDGHRAILTGYDANVGSTAVASSSTTTSPVVLRVVGTVDANGLVDTSTAVTDLSGNNIRSAVSTDGTSLWFTGAAGGVFAIQRGASTSTLVSSVSNTVDGGTASLTNFRQLEIFGAPQQLYASTSSGPSVRIGTVGSGLPTTGGQVVTLLPGLETGTGNGSPYAFFMADLDGTPGLDTLYVADDSSLGLQKWALVNGTWTLKGSTGGTSNAYRGVTGIASSGTVTLYVTGNGTTLSKLVDTAGFNATFSTTTPTWVVNAATGTAIRGVALAPH